MTMTGQGDSVAPSSLQQRPDWYELRLCQDLFNAKVQRRIGGLGIEKRHLNNMELAGPGGGS